LIFFFLPTILWCHFFFFFFESGAKWRTYVGSVPENFSLHFKFSVSYECHHYSKFSRKKMRWRRRSMWTTCALSYSHLRFHNCCSRTHFRQGMPKLLKEMWEKEEESNQINRVFLWRETVISRRVQSLSAPYVCFYKRQAALLQISARRVHGRLCLSTVVVSPSQREIKKNDRRQFRISE
jgi:hypothetical protein